MVKLDSCSGTGVHEIAHDAQVCMHVHVCCTMPRCTCMCVCVLHDAQVRMHMRVCCTMLRCACIHVCAARCLGAHAYACVLHDAQVCMHMRACCTMLRCACICVRAARCPDAHVQACVFEVGLGLCSCMHAYACMRAQSQAGLVLRCSYACVHTSVYGGRYGWDPDPVPDMWAAASGACPDPHLDPDPDPDPD